MAFRRSQGVANASCWTPLYLDLRRYALLQSVNQLPVALGRLLEGVLQGGLGAIAAAFADRRRDDEGAVGLVDEPLRPLAVCEPGPVPDQLVGKAPGDAGDYEPIVDVLEDAAIPLGQQVGDEVLDVPAAPSEAHVAEPGRDLHYGGGLVPARPYAFRDPRQVLVGQQLGDLLPVHAGA